MCHEPSDRWIRRMREVSQDIRLINHHLRQMQTWLRNAETKLSKRGKSMHLRKFELGEQGEREKRKPSAFRLNVPSFNVSITFPHPLRSLFIIFCLIRANWCLIRTDREKMPNDRLFISGAETLQPITMTYSTFVMLRWTHGCRDHCLSSCFRIPVNVAIYPCPVPSDAWYLVIAQAAVLAQLSTNKSRWLLHESTIESVSWSTPAFHPPSLLPTFRWIASTVHWSPKRFVLQDCVAQPAQLKWLLQDCVVSRSKKPFDLNFRNCSY